MPTYIGAVVLQVPISTRHLPRTLKFLGFAHPYSGSVGVRYVVCGGELELKNDNVPWKFIIAEHDTVLPHDLSDWLVAGTEFVGGKLVTVFAKQDNS